MMKLSTIFAVLFTFIGLYFLNINKKEESTFSLKKNLNHAIDTANINNSLTLNGIKYYWHLNIQDSIKQTIYGYQELRESETHKLALRDSDLIDILVTDDMDILTDSILHHRAQYTDVNFDGFTDIMMYNNDNSGSGGTFYNVYLFNPRNKSFHHSEELSGGITNIDKKIMVRLNIPKPSINTKLKTLIYS